ncbi:hypothetical protein EYF88_13455 [Paracoccus sediminis]|uniref:Uncharacterized protein n=1 Tax=Paracoccus sediminis TaxID=1214787 RepID=A0A238XI19_9RHOB|nr:hypothetical protein [Paracoccus sediminis]TBN48507.1 hypothetical protein EYF88_13455 [Paracoccus sediminis]SNR58228.1 hypothetical protein SAMN06265378_11046 [Paracoccus sediminis]
MAPEPQPRRGMSRALLYALIPIGFLILVAFMVLSGRDTSETAAEAAVEADSTVPQPAEGAEPAAGATPPAN